MRTAKAKRLSDPRSGNEKYIIQAIAVGPINILGYRSESILSRPIAEGARASAIEHNHHSTNMAK